MVKQTSITKGGADTLDAKIQRILQGSSENEAYNNPELVGENLFNYFNKKGKRSQLAPKKLDDLDMLVNNSNKTTNVELARKIVNKIRELKQSKNRLIESYTNALVTAMKEEQEHVQSLPPTSIQPSAAESMTAPGVSNDNEDDGNDAVVENIDLTNKTKEDLIEELSTLINGETCKSEEIANALSGFIDNYKPVASAVKKTDKTLKLNLDIYTDTEKNSKGYTTHGYKVHMMNEEHPFTHADEVSYFINNLVGYIEQSNLPEDKRTREPTNFFKPYKKSIYHIPVINTNAADEKKGGRNKGNTRRKTYKPNYSRKNKKQHNKATRKKPKMKKSTKKH